MRWRSLGRRSLTGTVVAGLMTVGLLPLPFAAGAHAATAAADVNLALGRPATAGGSHGAYPAGNTTDGTQASYSGGPGRLLPPVVQVDPGEARDVERVVLELPARLGEPQPDPLPPGQHRRLHLQRPRRLRRTGVQPGPDQHRRRRPHLPSDARYVRVHVTGNTGWNAAQLAELEVYGEEVVTEPPPTGTNLARNKPVEATSSVHSYVAANATDDSTSTYWEAAGHPADLTVRLGADADISAVVAKLNPDPVCGRPDSEHPGARPCAGPERIHLAACPRRLLLQSGHGQHGDHPGHRPRVRRTAPVLLQHRRARRPGRRVPGRRHRRARAPT